MDVVATEFSCRGAPADAVSGSLSTMGEFGVDSGITRLRRPVLDVTAFDVTWVNEYFS